MSIVSDDSGAVAALKALEDIRQLKFRYFRILDRGPRDELSDVLSEGIVCDLGDYGRYEGRTEVLDFFQTAVFPTYEMTVHTAHNPEITLLDDSRAEGTWVYEAYLLTGSSAATWLAGYYDDEYVVEDGSWRISSMTPTYYFNSDLSKDWMRAFGALGK